MHIVKSCLHIRVRSLLNVNTDLMSESTWNRMNFRRPSEPHKRSMNLFYINVRSRHPQENPSEKILS